MRYDLPEVPGQLIVILCAAPALLIVVGTVATLRRARIRRRKLRSFDPCDRCGFDLRATIGPCPDCGAVRPKPPEPQPKPEPPKQEILFDDFEDEQWHTS